MFGGTYSFYRQASSLKLEAVNSSEIFKYFSRSTLCKMTIFKLYIVHETAVYPNPHTRIYIYIYIYIYNFTGGRKTCKIPNRPTVKHVLFSRKRKEEQLL